MKISATATAMIIDGKPHCMAPIQLVIIVTAEDFGNSETKFNLRHNINLSFSGTGNTSTIILKPFKGNSLEALLMQTAKAKLVGKGMPMQSKEELKVLHRYYLKASMSKIF